MYKKKIVRQKYKSDIKHLSDAGGEMFKYTVFILLNQNITICLNAQ